MLAAVSGGVGALVRHMPMPVAEWWIQNWGTSILYEWMWMALVLALVPRRSTIIPVAVGVATMTVVLEFGQLWQPGWLQAIRATWVGRMMLGTTFSWWDVPSYPIGCALGTVLLRLVWGEQGNLTKG
ncbi:MAG: DUF2809 domain-containing protein [Planctomycetota bacterium]